MRINKSRLFVLLSVVGASVSLVQGLRNAIPRESGSQDFQWSPSVALLRHRDPYTIFLTHEGPSPFLLNQEPNYPASGLVLLWPYSLCDWSTAKALWAFSNVAFTGIIIWGLFQLLPVHTSPTIKLTLTALFIMSTPWRNGVGNGQHALLTLAFFLVAVVMILGGNRFAAIPLAVSWFKYTIAFPLTLFFARTRQGWGAILGAAAVHAVLTVFAAFWTESSISRLLLGPMEVALSATGKGYLDVFAIRSELGMTSQAVPVLASLALLSVTWLCIRGSTDVLSCLSTLAFVSMAVVFHCSYDYVVLVIPLAYALRERARGRRAKLYLITITLIWYVDKIAYIAESQIHTLAIAVALPAYYWLKVVLFYGTIASDWYAACKEDRAGGKAPPSDVPPIGTGSPSSSSTEAR